MLCLYYMNFYKKNQGLFSKLRQQKLHHELSIDTLHVRGELCFTRLARFAAREVTRLPLPAIVECAVAELRSYSSSLFYLSRA